MSHKIQKKRGPYFILLGYKLFHDFSIKINYNQIILLHFLYDENDEMIISKLSLSLIFRQKKCLRVAKLSES